MAVQAGLAGEDVGGRQDMRWVAAGKDPGQVGGGSAGGDQALDVAFRCTEELAQGGLSEPRPLLGPRRVGEVRGGEDARADRQRRRAKHLVSACDDDLRRAAAEVHERPLATDRVPAGGAQEAQLGFSLRGDHADRHAEGLARRADECAAIAGAADGLRGARDQHVEAV